MKANSDKSKQSSKATHRVLAGVLCGASVLSLVLSLVMPPISQAIANDAQTAPTEETVMGGGSSSESTDVDNATNRDTENQNSDDAEGDETGSSNSDEQAQAEDQLEGELQAEDGDSSNNGAVMAAAEGGQTETAPEAINSVDELKNKLTDASGVASFKLAADIETSKTITLNKDGSDITLDLNGYKIKHESLDQPLFSIIGGATLTVKDSRQAAPTGIETNQGNKYGNLASMEYDAQIPTSLTYYVTESTARGTGTTETLKAYRAGIAGAIVACGGNSYLKLINLYKNNGKGGTFKLESGVITQQQGSSVSSLVYAEDGSTVAVGGGYICGASGSGAGGGIEVRNNSNLSISGGVIAGNSAPSGGGVFAGGSVVTVTDGIISGNSTLANTPGFGGGVMGEGSNITVSGGYVTNNACQYDYNNKGESIYQQHNGNGCHGGGGIAALSSGDGQTNGSLAINGGYITGNYSAEAGGGIYAGAWGQALSSFKFSGGTIASNVAQNSEGGGIRIAAPTVGVFEVPKGSHAYITNNTTNTTNDWGGGGVFVQGSSDQGIKSASLNIYNALITNNHANGFGGGFAACPTGKTAITDTNGIAIFGNSDGKPDGKYNRSGGTHGKNDDADWLPENKGGEITDEFKKAGHQDLFLIRDQLTSGEYIAAVTGQMLGGGAAKWSGTIDNNTLTSIGKYEGAQAKFMIGLKSDPTQEDKDAATAAATLYITGNSSNIHGGGIMTNGDVVAGSTQEVKVYPKMKLNGTKMLTGRELKNEEFEFMLLKQGADKKAPSFGSDGTLQPNGCSVVNTVKNDGNGNFAFDLGEVYADADLVYYLVEVPGADKDVINYDNTIYRIDPTVVEETSKTHSVLGITYTYYKVESVSVTKVKNDGTGAKASETESAAIAAAEGENAATITLTKGATFTNTYTSSGSWTPKATKVVKGGEMKEFTLEFADDAGFKEAETVKTDARKVITTADGDKLQKLDFPTIEYTLDSLKQSDSDVPISGATKTFYYYVHEKDERSTYPHYKFDQSVYRFKVVATDNTKGGIDCAVTYKKGSVGSDGEWKPDPDAKEQDLTVTSTPNSTPTFTNTYSTSLPLSGMSGVTLTYLAGAAVLCAAAAWMHIRRKANAKGGERRE